MQYANNNVHLMQILFSPIIICHVSTIVLINGERERKLSWSLINVSFLLSSRRSLTSVWFYRFLSRHGDVNLLTRFIKPISNFLIGTKIFRLNYNPFQDLIMLQTNRSLVSFESVELLTKVIANVFWTRIFLRYSWH